MSPTVDSFRKEFNSTPFFSSQQDYERFRIRFSEALRPDLQKTREARRKSEDAARNRYIS